MTYQRPCRDLTGHDFNVEIGPGLMTKFVVDKVTVVRARDLDPDADDVLAFALRLPTTGYEWPNADATLHMAARVGVRGEEDVDVIRGFGRRWELRRGEVVGEPWFVTTVSTDAHIVLAEVDVVLAVPGT
ncbi:hypothetical protein [Clavibacter michiganensis]|uniref:hypothetical protein n=1 Tax=Clavibacter michiganensis TaxID=28447 RepID=UPI00307930B2